MKLWITFLIVQLKSTYSLYIDDPLIQTSLGPIRGSVLNTGYNEPVYQFLGIRYAKLPDNTTSQEAQLVVDKWKDVYNANNYKPSCPLPENKETSEDCFYLNIFTTKLPHNHINTKRSVFVLVYPGGYRFDQNSVLDPYTFLNQNITIVSVNYRSGRFDVKDIVVALKWTKNHIEAFGGNPNSITVAVYNVGRFRISTADLFNEGTANFLKVLVMTVKDK
ncbi:hypothetical protein RN001_013635 [Aquatica leii]|uniref:Carboxylesterase type B domain-containing protein n=1 Tax=Aquatica leii TaxID=1421715 RepID=A0AAN7SNT5_9COLE|nr:hypothetical protein RN001_013635 [Aquatica leii]